jgi:hypothetical protein
MIPKSSSKHELDNKASALASSYAGKHSSSIAEHVWVAALLKDLPLSAHQRQRILPGPGASLLDKFQLLGHVKPNERLAFFEAVIARARDGCRNIDVLCAVLMRAGYFLQCDERSLLFTALNQEKPTAHISKCMLALARSAQSLQDARQLIKECGLDRLMRHGNRELRELVATVELVSILRRIKRPEPLPMRTRSEAGLQKAETDLKLAYARVRSLLGAQVSWAGKSPKLTALKSAFKLSEKKFRRDYAAAETPAEKNLVLRLTLARFATELRYGKAFTEEPPASRSQREAHWSIDELATIVRGIKLVGEFPVIVESGISEFKRIASLVTTGSDTDVAEDHLADWDTNGVLWFSDSTFTESRRGGRAYRTGRTPLEVVVHELAHGLSCTELTALMKPKDDKTPVALSDFLKPDHFPEVFLNLGRWYSAKTGFRVDSEADLVYLRDAAGKEQSITMQVPVYIETDKDARKEPRVYNYLPDYHLLIWHEPRKAEFTDRAYARQDPTDMLAELYGSYFNDRRTVFRLIQNAPHLFWYMESLYHKYAGDEAMLNSLRARLSPKRESGLAVKALEREGSVQSVFRMLTDEEQIEIVTKLGGNIESSAKLRDSREARLRFFTSIDKRETMAQQIQEIVAPVLARYNQGILLARMILAGGGDVAIATMRGATENDPNSQQPMLDALHDALGGRFDEKNNIYFLDDYHRSGRLKTKPFLKKLEQVVTEKLLGFSSRAPGQVKSQGKMYDAVMVYTGLPAVAEYLRAYARRKGIKKSLQVVELNSLSSSSLARGLLRRNQMYSPNTLHFFTLEDTLLDLEAHYRVVMKGSGGLQAPPIPPRKFLKKVYPRGWLTEVSERKNIAEELLEIDKSDFTSRAALNRQLNEGRSNNKMLKGFARD